MLGINTIKLSKRLALSLALTLMTLAYLLATNAQAAKAWSDGVWWGNCSGRYTVLSPKYIQNGKVTVYGCSNGYYFVNTTAYNKAKVTAVITRRSPWGQQIAVNNYGYSATTNMVARLSGSCYDVWGYAGYSGGGFAFCRN